MASCEMTRKEFARFLAGAFDLARAYASPGAIIYACKDVGTWPKCSPPAISELRAFELFVWVKTNGGMGSLYRSRHEFVFVFRNGGTPPRRKVLRGAARASRLSGAPLSIHLPGWERLAHRVLDVVESEGADLRHVVLCHMNPSLHDHKYQRSLADRGAFIEYDMIGMDYFYADQQAQSPCDEENAIAICKLVEDGYRNSILMSQDVFLKMMLVRYGGFRLRLYPQAFRPAPEAPWHGSANDRPYADRKPAAGFLRRASRALTVASRGAPWRIANQDDPCDRQRRGRQRHAGGPLSAAR